MRRGDQPSVGAFVATGYVILDQDLLAHGELVISSTNPGPPSVGDLYTVQSGGALHEVKVDRVTMLKRGWSAHCKVFGLAA